MNRFIRLVFVLTVLHYNSYCIVDIYCRLIMKLISANVAGRLVPPSGLLEQRSADAPPVPVSRAIGVLVVDDFDDLRGIVCECVRRLGYGALEASTAVAAMSLLEGPLGSQIDIVLSDVNLPDLSGVALAGLVRARWPHLKVLLMSGDAPVGNGGSNCPYLQKPFRRQALAAALSGLDVAPGESRWLADRSIGSTDAIVARSTT